jgi:hypothetical protein
MTPDATARAAAPAASTPTTPDPKFAILAVEAVPHAAAPTLVFTGSVSETAGRDVYMIALTVQIMIDPARRSYNDDTRERLVELFGAPERWASTTHSFLWAELNVLVPDFTGSTSFRIPMLCNYDLELAATKYLHSVSGGEVPLTFNFTGTLFYRGDAGHLQIVKIPWDSTFRYQLPVTVWREMIDGYYPGGGWVRLADETLDRLGRHKADAALPTFDATVADLLERA